MKKLYDMVSIKMNCWLVLSVSALFLYSCGTPAPIAVEEEVTEEDVVEEIVEELIEEEKPIELTLDYLKSLSADELKEMDSDGDGISDYDEIYKYGTNPLSEDTDGDGLSDHDEIFVYRTDPLVRDLSNDLVSDYNAIYRHGVDRYDPDTDGDGISDGDEITVYNTDPLRAETRDTQDDYLSAIAPTMDRLRTASMAREQKVEILFYALREFELNESHIQVLDEILPVLQRDRRTVYIYGYSDTSGFQSYNESLTRRRAYYIAQYLVDNGIPMSRLRFVKGGIEQHPSCEYIDCPDSRRAEIWLKN